MRHHRGLVAAAGADLERFSGSLAVHHGLDHARDDVGMRDGLAEADRQRVILVGAAGERFLEEKVARHAAERAEHPLIAYALAAQAVHHPRAGSRGGHADSAQRSSQARARGSWAA